MADVLTGLWRAELRLEAGTKMLRGPLGDTQEVQLDKSTSVASVGNNLELSPQLSGWLKMREMLFS